MQQDKVYQVITDRILALLEQGTIPWHKPWQGGDMLPRNLVSKKEYRGANVFLLHAMSFGSPFWLTFKQAKALGGKVRKGEKACPVIFWNWVETKDKDSDKVKKIPFLRYYSVFNVDQCEGIEAPPIAKTEREHTPLEAGETIVKGMPKRPLIKHGGGRAFYSPSSDTVTMPEPEHFTQAEDYYSVCFHELAHATGHASRLNRKGVSGSEGEWSAFGSTPYAKEELVAEMSAAFLCGHAGIVERTVDNSAAYVASWLERLRSDVRLVVQAAAQAQKAADFILGQGSEVSE